MNRNQPIPWDVGPGRGATYGPQQLAWQALVADTDSLVGVLDGDGHILFANEVARRGLGVDPGADLSARTIHEFFPDDYVDERLSIVRRVLETGKALTVLGMTFGSWNRSVYRPVPPDNTAVLVVCRPATDADRADATDAACEGVIQARTHDMGPLAALTQRELEVLRLIGEGLSTAQIADKLHRSVKTMEWHRVALGAKLKVKSRVELARIALRAGLSNLHAGAQRLPM